MVPEMLSVLDLTADQAVTSSAGGVIADTWADYPQTSPDWTAMTTTFGEYRVLAMELRFVPNVQGATVASVAYAPFYVVWDSSQSTTTPTPLASYSAASQYVVSRIRALNEPWSIDHRMNGSEEATFVPTSNNAVDYAFKTYASGLTASTTYGRYFVRWKCQFRGRL